ncbi:methionine--tRNA ligase subunit beta [Candidatus Dependentiae bacterium]|nr:MAG: methionine--tRNA ligase subunit beta [Candidatus Dependentiae bacterium]
MPVNSDGDFSTGDLEQTITSDLANDLGNLLNRMVSLATRNGLEQISAGDEWHEAAATLQKAAKVAFDAYGEHMEKYEFHLALARLWKFINQTNAYFHEQEPWKLAKADQKLFGEVISATCHSLRMIGVLLLPIMPEKMNALLQSIGVALNEQDTLTSLQLTTWNQPFTLTKIPTLFQKLEDKGQNMEKQKKEESSVEEKTYATIDDVIKVELRVGTITQAEIIPESEKLLKFQVDFGELGTRQILAGVRKFYEPDQFVGKQGVFVFNLKPRKMVGMESQGMMLVAKDNEGKPIMVTVPSTVPNGTRLS